MFSSTDIRRLTLKRFRGAWCNRALRYLYQRRTELRTVSIGPFPRVGDSHPKRQSSAGEKMNDKKEPNSQPFTLEQTPYIPETESESCRAAEKYDAESPTQTFIAEPAYESPATTLLDLSVKNPAQDREDLERQSHRLLEMLDMFGVRGDLVAAFRGPVFTTYEFKPGPGVRFSQVTNLKDGIAMTLNVEDVTVGRVRDRLPDRRRS